MKSLSYVYWFSLTDRETAVISRSRKPINVPLRAVFIMDTTAVAVYMHEHKKSP